LLFRQSSSACCLKAAARHEKGARR
jgi:hypothetical protein